MLYSTLYQYYMSPVPCTTQYVNSIYRRTASDDILYSLLATHKTECTKVAIKYDENTCAVQEAGWL